MFSNNTFRLFHPIKILFSLNKSSPFSGSNSKIPQRLTHSYSKMLSVNRLTPIAQGIKGQAELITGNFAYFTKKEATAITESLSKSKVFVIIYDRDTIPVPANERATWIREYFKHNPNLEIRIAYGPPGEKVTNPETYANYIKKQLPEQVVVSSVRCDHSYSPALAKLLNVPFQPSESLKDALLIEHFIKNTNKDPNGVLFDFVRKRVFSSFGRLINSQEFEQQYKQEAEKIRLDIEKLNPNHPNQDMFYARTPWNTKNLNKLNMPLTIGQIATENRPYFDKRTNTQVFDMPIYMPNQGWRIPRELSPYLPALTKIVAAESLSNTKMRECITYITTDYGIVAPAGHARREGLHVDGFLTKANARADQDGIIWGDNTYIVSNRQELQTEFYAGPFNLNDVDTENPQAVLQAFSAQGKNMPYSQANAYDIVKLTCNNVHAVHPNTSGMYIERSFMKVTFSTRLFNRGGNTVNPQLQYRFMYMPRKNGRNTQNLSGSAPLGYEDVDLSEINFSKQVFPSWTAQHYQLVSKNPNIIITAVPAVEGEILETKVDGNIVTTNVARAGDMKVTRIDGDSYFLGENFKRLYKPVSENKYSPTERTLKSIRVLKNISFLAQWGTRQNIPSGGYILQDNEEESWGVHEESFNASYQN